MVNIKIKKLIEILERFDPEKYVIVFIDETSTIYDVFDVSDNGGNAQLNIE